MASSLPLACESLRNRKECSLCPFAQLVTNKVGCLQSGPSRLGTDGQSRKGTRLETRAHFQVFPNFLAAQFSLLAELSCGGKVAEGTSGAAGPRVGGVSGAGEKDSTAVFPGNVRRLRPWQRQHEAQTRGFRRQETKGSDYSGACVFEDTASPFSCGCLA